MQGWPLQPEQKTVHSIFYSELIIIAKILLSIKVETFE